MKTKTEEEIKTEKHDLEVRKTNLVLTYRNVGYIITMVYLGVVCLLSFSLVLSFWLLLFGIKAAYIAKGIAYLGAGTAGLGAGSLVFKVPLARLFHDDVGESNQQQG